MKSNGMGQTYYSGRVNLDDDTGIMAITDKHQLAVNIGGGRINAPIKFCPNCGRFLNGGSNDLLTTGQMKQQLIEQAKLIEDSRKEIKYLQQFEPKNHMLGIPVDKIKMQELKHQCIDLIIKLTRDNILKQLTPSEKMFLVRMNQQLLKDNVSKDDLHQIINSFARLLEKYKDNTLTYSEVLAKIDNNEMYEEVEDKPKMDTLIIIKLNDKIETYLGDNIRGVYLELQIDAINLEPTLRFKKLKGKQLAEEFKKLVV
jgi:hypothetical protein